MFFTHCSDDNSVEWDKQCFRVAKNWWTIYWAVEKWESNEQKQSIISDMFLLQNVIENEKIWKMIEVVTSSIRGISLYWYLLELHKFQIY